MYRLFSQVTVYTRGTPTWIPGSTLHTRGDGMSPPRPLGVVHRLRARTTGFPVHHTNRRPQDTFGLQGHLSAPNVTRRLLLVHMDNGVSPLPTRMTVYHLHPLEQ